MKVISSRNVHQILPEALRALKFEGIERNSRNGEVLAFPEPVTSVYRKPLERVIYWAERDANPFFHLYESLWMLGGKNDVESLAFYVERMRSFSDDGVTFHGAYGYRWRQHFDFDQVQTIINTLKANHDDRRQVLSMWDARVDLGFQGKDFPCNLQAVFSVTHEGKLDMMATNRSNDLIWGAYGANAVHFSFLQEYVAAGVGVPVGVYRQVSNNLHAYRSVLGKVSDLSECARDVYVPHDTHWFAMCPYESGEAFPFPLIADLETFNAELKMFLQDNTVMGFTEPFFRKIAIPMVLAYGAFKNRDNPERYREALDHLARMPDKNDWKLAAVEWVNRRWEKAQRQARAEDDGVFYDN